MGIILGVGIAFYIALIKKLTLLSILPPFMALGAFLFYASGLTGGSVETSLVGQVGSMANTYSTDFVQRSLNGKLVVYLSRMVTFILAFSTFIMQKNIIKTNRNGQIIRLFILHFFILLALIFNVMIFNRYTLVVEMLAVLVIATNFNEVPKKNQRTVLVVILIAVMISVITAYAGIKQMTFDLSKFEIFTSGIYSLISTILRF